MRSSAPIGVRTDAPRGARLAADDRGRGRNPFTPQAKTIDPMGKVTDGPAGSPASGYSIIQASSLDDAVKLAKDCPVLQGGAKISVYETFEVM